MTDLTYNAFDIPNNANGDANLDDGEGGKSFGGGNYL